MPSENVGLRESIAKLASLLLTEQSLAQELSSIIQLIPDAIPGSDHASVSIARADRYETLVASDAVAEQFDQAQYDHDDGPCLTAIRSGTVIAVEDREQETRFREFFASPGTENIGSSLSFPLSASGTVVGSLNMYAGESYAYSLDDHPIASRLAEQTSIVLGNALVRDQALVLARQIDEAIQNRGDIEQAKGILMAREGVDADGAFALLRRSSQQHNKKLHEVARTVIAETVRRAAN